MINISAVFIKMSLNSICGREKESRTQSFTVSGVSQVAQEYQLMCPWTGHVMWYPWAGLGIEENSWSFCVACVDRKKVEGIKKAGCCAFIFAVCVKLNLAFCEWLLQNLTEHFIKHIRISY